MLPPISKSVNASWHSLESKWEYLAKTRKLSRHQKYRQLMLLCKEVNDWLSCKQSWCTYEQKDLFTMFNTTTNRIEAHHRVLKLYLKSSASLERMYTSVNTSDHSSILQPFFKHCTSFAAHKIAKEYKRASSRSYQIIKLDDGFKVCGTMVCIIPQLMSSCTCSFFSAMKLPCHHLIHLLV